MRRIARFSALSGALPSAALLFRIWQPNTPPAELSGPTIHVPSADVGEEGGAVNGDEAAAPKKKTRRGSRGGRGRKKKPATQVDVAQTAVEIAEPVGASQAATEPAAADKKPTRRGSRGGRRRRKPAAAASGEATTAGGETAVAEPGSGSDQL